MTPVSTPATCPPAVPADCPAASIAGMNETVRATTIPRKTKNEM